MSAFRGVFLLTMMGLGLMAASARAEDFEAGKSAAKIFESDCTTCHRSPRGLAKGMSSRALVDFLREHYTTGLGPANELAGYLESGATDGDDHRAVRPTGDAPRAGDQRQRAQTVGAPADATTDQPGSSARKHRRAATTPEPEATSEHDAAAPPTQTHKRHHARSVEPTNEAQPPADGQPSTSSDLQMAPAEVRQPVAPTRESRRKHPRAPKNAEPAQAAKQSPEMTPTGSTGGPAGGASEPSQSGTGPARDGASAAAQGAEPDQRTHADAAAEPGSNATPALPSATHASETAGASEREPPSSASGTSDQPAFSAPSP